MANIKLGNDTLNGVNTVRLQKADGEGYESFVANPLNAEWHQCPELVRNYLANVTYNPSDYSNSEIANYAPATPVASNTKPIGKTVGGATYYNEVPNMATPFSTDVTAGTLRPLDFLRWINPGLIVRAIRSAPICAIWVGGRVMAAKLSMGCYFDVDSLPYMQGQCL